MVIRDSTVIMLLHFLCADLLPGDSVLGCSEKQLRSDYAAVAGALDLAKWACRPYSLRRGGATWLFRVTGRIDEVCLRGRWGNIVTCRRYIDDGCATLAAIDFSDSQVRNFAALGAEFRTWVRRIAAWQPCK